MNSFITRNQFDIYVIIFIFEGEFYGYFDNLDGFFFFLVN